MLTLKSVCNRFFIKCILYGWKDVVKVEQNDPLKHASKLHGFPFTSSTNTEPFMGVKFLTPINGRPC